MDDRNAALLARRRMTAQGLAQRIARQEHFANRSPAKIGRGDVTPLTSPNRAPLDAALLLEALAELPRERGGSPLVPKRVRKPPPIVPFTMQTRAQIKAATAHILAASGTLNPLLNATGATLSQVLLANAANNPAVAMNGLKALQRIARRQANRAAARDFKNKLAYSTMERLRLANARASNAEYLIQKAIQNTKSRRQGLIGAHNKRRQLIIDQLNASNYYRSGMGFTGKGLYRKRRRRTSLYPSRKPKRKRSGSKLNRLAKLMCSMRKRTRY